MKKIVQARARHSQVWCAIVGRFLAALALLAGLGATTVAQAQPTVLGTDAYSGTYTTYNLVTVGGFRQYRGRATASSTDNARQWQFAQGTAASTDYNNKWMPYSNNNIRYRIAGFNQFIAPNTAYPPTTGTATSVGAAGVPGGLPAIAATNYYTFNITSNSGDNNLGVLETTFLPVTIGSPTNSTPGYNQPVTVTATLGGTPNAAENFFLRYTTNGYNSSTVQQMSKSGNTVSGTIPAQTSSTVSYYIFSSNEATNQLTTDASTYGQPVYDMATLNLSPTVSYSSSALNGTYTINPAGSGSTNFTTFASAFSALISQGISGPVFFNVKDGQTFTENNLNLLAVGGASATNRITFQRDNSGSPAPLVQASTGIAAGQQDAIIKLQGADFITFDGINVAENTGNGDLGAGNNQAMEYGYALFRSSNTDGCQSNIIRNCTITLNRANSNPTYGIWVANTDIGGNVQNASNAAGTNSNNTFTGNTIGNCRYGIDMAGQGMLDTGNVIGSATTLALGNTISTVTTFGILAYEQSGLVIGSNTISFPTGNTSLMYGIVVGSNTAGALVAGNRVRTLKYTGSSGIGVRGISFNPGSIAAGITVRNNAVSDLSADGGTGTDINNQLMGIGLLSGTGYNIYNNSVQLNDNRAANGRTGKVSAALYVASGVSGIDLRNNVLSNVQTTSDATQPGTNYAVYAAAASGNPFTTIDYNLYDLRSGAAARPALLARTTANSPQYLGRLAGADVATLAAWKTATGQDRSSMLSSGTNTAGFTSSISLVPNAADGNSYVLNGTGVQIASVTTDLTGAARSTTVAGGAPDLGAYEFTPSATSNPLDATGTVGPGQTQSFALNGRPIAAITYGTGGTLPSSVTARYYPGTNPPAPYASGARFANAYFALNDELNNGSGYTYALTTYYDPALLGTVSSEAQQRLSPQTSTGYTTVPTTVNTTNRTLTSSATLTNLGVVAISDGTAPLPVELMAFAAVRQATAALLTWATASEQNNAGFEVQVSVSGTEGSFRKLGFVAGAGSSALAHSYSFRDVEEGKAGLRYYRLRQVDGSGQESYSPVRTVQFEAPAEVAVHALPNPFANSLAVSLSLPTAGPATAVLTDALGRVVLRQNLGQLPAGTSQPALGGVADLPAGIYVLHLAVAGSMHTIKVVKE